MTALIVIAVIGLCIAFVALAPAWITIGIILLLLGVTICFILLLFFGLAEDKINRRNRRKYAKN